MRPSPSLLAASLALAARLASAQSPAAGSGDARASFARAVTLYADSDFEAALVEFQRSYTLSQNPNLLYNLGAVYESLGRFVEARDALVAYRSRGARAAVTARSAELTARLARLAERIGTLHVTVSAPGLRVFVDGREISEERARAGVAVSAGRRRVRIEAPRHVAREVDLDVVGGSDHVESAPLEVSRAPLTLRCDTDGATVRVDGLEVGRTPLAGPVSLAEGVRHLEVVRAGYLGVVRDVELGSAGAVVDAALAWDPAMPPSIAARLRVESNVAFPTVSLDGQGVASDGSGRVPPGAHQLRVAHAGYVPVARTIELSPGENAARVWLDATDRLRSDHAARVRRQRAVAYVFLGAGVAMLAGGIPLLVLGVSDRATAQSEVDRIDAAEDRCMETGCSTDAIQFNALRAPHQDAFTAATVQAVVGGALTAVGLAGVVTGAVLRGRADPADRYDRPAGWTVSAGLGSVTLRGVF